MNSSPFIVSTKIEDVVHHVDNLCLKYKPEEILVLFDIDMTLTLFDHPAVSFNAIRKHYSDVFRSIMKPLTDEQRDGTSVKLVRSIPQVLVDEKQLPRVLKNLSDRHVKSIAFTAILAGNGIEKFRYESLKKMGVSFEDSFDLESLTIAELPFYYRHQPSFYKGILFSNGEYGPYGKGDVLYAFLKRIKFYPKAIVLIDDRQLNLTNVRDVLKKSEFKPEFVGIEYEGSSRYNPSIAEKDFSSFWKDIADQKIKN